MSGCADPTFPWRATTNSVSPSSTCATHWNFSRNCGAEIAAPIEQLKSLQDYLGDLQDAVIACNRLNHFWMWGTLETPTTPRAPVNSPPLVAPDVARYHASRQQEIQEKVAAFPTLWGQFQTSDFFRQMAKAISIL
jgi:hypothetical protein